MISGMLDIFKVWNIVSTFGPWLTFPPSKCCVNDKGNVTFIKDQLLNLFLLGLGYRI
jgi:hypothetical protein